MARVTSAKTRQAILVTGDPLEENTTVDRIQLFNEDGDPLMLGTEGVRVAGEQISAFLNAGDEDQDAFTAKPSIRLFKIATNRPARVRVYPTAAQRDADISRGIGSKPPPNSGRLLEVVTLAGMLELTLSPVVDLVSQEEFFEDFFTSIANLDDVAGAVVVTYHYIRTE